MKHSDKLLERLKVSISISKDKDSIEKNYYEGLARCLKSGDFISFKELFDASLDFDIFLDVNRIPRRFLYISELLLNCTKRIVNEFRISALGDQIDILKSCNDFGLLEKELNKVELRKINLIKKDNLFLSNLHDLFGRVSDSLICYVYLEFPNIIFNYINTLPNEYYSNQDDLMYNIKHHFFNHYTIYGLSVRYLSTVRQFIDIFNSYFENKVENHNFKLIDNDKNFINFEISYPMRLYGIEETRIDIDRKNHFVSVDNILKNIDNILEGGIYKFYSISMVLLGGLGPQGLGFTYSTPKGEIIEICSDQKETEAIIIKFKQYLKRKFLGRLRKELSIFNIKEEIIKKIIDYLSDILNPNEKITYYDKNLILNRVKDFLHQINDFRQENSLELKEIIKKISKAISVILRDIKLKDQFITRMNLVREGKIKSEDIAKLTSLRGKSHYDVLRERFFWQYIVDQMYNFYQEEISKLEQ